MTVNSNKSPSSVRIIGGAWRSRRLQVLDTPGLRPTPDRVRETLFNWLQFSLVGARCLDLFAGTGILALEALSRGAAQATALELDPRAAALLRQQGQLLCADNFAVNRLPFIEEPFIVEQCDAITWLERKTPAPPYDLVFLDPPYASRLQVPCCELLHRRGWLAPGARIYLEAAEPLNTLALPSGWRLTRHKRAGEVYYGLCERGAQA
ncbi:MAG: 16S rRNA (guanine(966)-N(2))-methyltransferase RsmD [Pseudomonadales bacterium]|jgi:16S rRNA (guanine966-N2)-methyltransferase|nr:16S rRNA (guanine(966)-N(2))-methyltransferase RsmD [Pseudomonadales bacterium]